MIASYGEDTVAAFIAELISGAMLGAENLTDDYWRGDRRGLSGA